VALEDPMRGAKSDRTFIRTLRIAFCAFLLSLLPLAAFAQEPPLDVPKSALPAQPPQDAHTIGDWLVYPTLRVYTQYSDNLFQSPQAPLNVWGFGTTPGLVAEWSNGIHTTTLYGNVDRQVYPTDNAINTFDHDVGMKQKYEMLRDLMFSANVDYTHKTIASTLQSSLPTQISVPTTTVLPNGNIELPNGTIVSPSGVPVGQATPSVVASQTSLVNPYDQYTGTFSVTKILNRGILGLSTSVARTNYETQSLQDFTTKSFAGNGAIWLGPLIYLYSNGTIATNTGATASAGSVTSYKAVGGIGTRQIGLIKGSLYYGHQGSEASQGSTSGGEVFGASLSYFPTPPWTIGASFDETVNVASAAFASQFALALPGQTPVQIPVGSSTRVTSTSLQSTYQFSQQWSTAGRLAYSRIEYLDSPRLDNTWSTDLTLTYDIWRNMSIVWEYQYTNILSNAPLTSSTRNFVVMGTTYKF
jgi:hypothetical protein